jgi:hypothetical protein
MIGIERPPIKTNVGSEPTELEEPLGGVVTVLAERLERTEPELIDVAVMRLHVIADCRRRHDAALQAILTKWVFEQLVLPDPGPATR